MSSQLPGTRLMSGVEHFEKKSEKWNRWVVRCRQFICRFWMNCRTCWFTKWKNMLRCLIKLQVLTAGQIGQQMTGISSYNCRRIYFAAQEFSNWVTEYNSDITNVRYILFYTTNELVPVLGKDYRVHAIIYDCCGTGATLSSNSIIPKTPGSIKVEKNYRGVITTEEGVNQPKFLVAVSQHQ